MNNLRFLYNHAGISTDALAMTYNTLLPQIRLIAQEFDQNNLYNGRFAPLHTPFDRHIVATIYKAVSACKLLNPKLFILIGIGGSNLGTLALMQALYSQFYALAMPGIPFYCADTLDANLLTYILDIAERILKQGDSIVVNIVTKSGTTAETLANGALFVDLLKKYKPDTYHTCVVITTDAYSPLWYTAQEEQFHVLEIPTLVGGRYSVLSAVGLFPLAFMGVDIEELLAGARSAYAHAVSYDMALNSAAVRAAILYNSYQEGRHIHDMFVFSPDLSMLGAWYRQLMGESLGKAYTVSGDRKEIGITPTVSIGTADLHSVAQLYLGGPRDKITTFVSFSGEDTTLTIPSNSLSQLVPALQHTSVSSIKQSILQAVEAAYAQEQRPYMSAILPQKSAYALGQFIMIALCEVIYCAYLFDINPFDQPAVELYKAHVRKLLAHTT